MNKLGITLLIGFIMLSYNIKVLALENIGEYWHYSDRVTSHNQEHSAELLMGVVAKVVWDNTYGGYVENFAQSVWDDMLGRNISSSKIFPMRLEFKSSIQSTDLILIYRF